MSDQPTAQVATRSRPRILPCWLGGVLAVLLADGPWLLAVLVGYTDAPKARSVAGVGLLVLIVCPLAAATIAAPVFGLRRPVMFWRLTWPVANLVFAWQLGIRAMEAVNRAATAVH